MCCSSRRCRFGCIDANPQFANAGIGDYQLVGGSPAVDAGLNWLLPKDVADADEDGDTAELVDIDRLGHPRIMIGTGGDACSDMGLVDMGAYEVEGDAVDPVNADLNGDGVVGPADLAIVLSNWGESVECPLYDLNGDGLVNAADLAFVLNEWS